MPARKGQKFKPRKPQDLIDMEAVETQLPEEDKPHHTKLRSWYDSDIKSWLARKDRLRAAHEGRGGPEPEEPAVATEVLPEEPVEVLIQTLIDEAKARAQRAVARPMV